MNLYHVDAFAREPFTGNPAAVCLMPAFADDDWLLQFAGDMNLSETAYLVSRDGEWDLRWFTPATEVDLCGHATLASAHILWTEGWCESDEITFHTRSGALQARRCDHLVELSFPLTPAEPASPPEGLLHALGTTAEFVGRGAFDYLVEVADEATLRGLEPDFRELAAIKARGVIVTSRAAGTTCDFVSRYFAPAYGIDEDPVTGSAHCSLGPYWSEKLGRQTLTGFQASRRGGYVQVEVTGDRALLRGAALTVARGEVALPHPSADAS